MSELEDGSTWVAVADFLVTVLAVFVMIYAGSQQKDPCLIELVTTISKTLKEDQSNGRIREFEADDRQVRIVYSDQALGFPDCGWDLSADAAIQIRQHMEQFAQVEDYINLLQIEGHADIRRPTGCERLKFRTNFELSETRAASVFAALLGSSIDKLDALVADAATTPLSGLVGRLAGRQQVLVAGFGATRPVPGYPPEDQRHRRVELRITFTDKPDTGAGRTQAALLSRCVAVSSRK
jgi:flagellar motor protein MotB